MRSKWIPIHLEADNINELNKLAILIREEALALMTAWRNQVKQLPSARNLDAPTLNDHIPGFLEELSAALRAQSNESIADALCEGGPQAHGQQRFLDGFDIEEVVAEYNILRCCIHDLAETHRIRLQGLPFQILNRVLDGAIGLAVQTFAAQQATEIQLRREEYLAFVAHDLRTPLNAISLATYVLELTLPQNQSSSEATQMLKALRRNVQHLEALVGKVVEENTNLQSEAGMKLQRRWMDLWPIVEGLIYDLMPLAKKAGVRLTNQVPDDFVVYADASLLRRVFQNLIANAIKYTPQGEIIIGARQHDQDRIAECFVSDNGAGIPDDRLDKVFEKLETDSEQIGGMGLGLAIVKSFVEAHDGTVVVESQIGVGSTFRFTLPPKSASPKNK